METGRKKVEQDLYVPNVALYQAEPHPVFDT